MLRLSTITGSLIWNEAYQDNLNSDDPWQVAFAGFTTEGTGITSAGLVVCAGSIPFFILSSNNKRKAIQLGVQTQKVPRLNDSQLSKKGIAVLTLKLNL